MNPPRLTIACLALLAGLAGSAPAGAVSPPMPEAEAQQLIESSDWNAATVVSVELHDHHYVPGQLRFEKGRPYILRLKNVGGQAHDMKGSTFFTAIVARMATSQAGRVVTPYMRSIYVRPKQEIELWFVPVKTGTFDFFCTLDGHREAGMEGAVVIH